MENRHLEKLIAGYTRYNQWANEKLTGWLKTLDQPLLYKETRSSYASIDLTMQHMNRAQNFWLAIITGTGVTKLDERIKFNAVDTTMSDLLAGSRQMVNVFTAYAEAELLQQLVSTDMVRSRYEYILHVINHNSYHRGQIVTMSRHLGVENNLPAMDYEVFLWSV